MSQQNAEFDLLRVHKLVAEIEAELAHAPLDSPAFQSVRDEIETLKNVLKSPKPKPHWIRDSLQIVRDEIATDSPFVAKIGHVLGLS